MKNKTFVYHLEHTTYDEALIGQILNRLGQEGWELVSSLQAKDGVLTTGSNREGYLFIFKKEIG
jgi:hypothetical protein